MEESEEQEFPEVHYGKFPVRNLKKRTKKAPAREVEDVIKLPPVAMKKSASSKAKPLEFERDVRNERQERRKRQLISLKTTAKLLKKNIKALANSDDSE